MGEANAYSCSHTVARIRLEYSEDIVEDIKKDPEIKNYYDKDFVVNFDTRMESLKKLLEEKVFELESGYENMASFNLDYCEVGFRCDNCTYERYEHLLEETEEGKEGEDDALF